MTVEAYAKVNLTLEVFGKRSDGYHALRSVVLPISLSDTLVIEATTDGTLTCDTGYPDDLCLKAARILRDASNSQLPTPNPQLGARIRVTKRIPAGGGLGGGSADAAATLRALNEVWALGKSVDDLVAIAADVGSDVPALVHGGLVLMEGRGECVTALGSAPSSPIHLVLANPGVFCSTAEVYSRCTPRSCDETTLVRDVCQAFASGDLSRLSGLMTNDLQAPACALHPEIAATLASLRAAGAEGVLMSGSGSTVFGFAPSEARAREIAAALEARGLWARVVRAIA